MATQLQTTSALYADAPAQHVFVRERWGDQWQLVPHLACLEFSSVAAPDISTATLRYVYGIGMPPGQLAESIYPPKRLAGNYVKISVVGLWDWYGTILELSDDRHRAEINNGRREPKGVEFYTAYGLEILLDQQPVRQSVVRNDDGSERTIERAIIFNEGQGNEGTKRHSPLAGNRSSDFGSFQTYRFTNQLDSATTAKTWTARQIIDYLFAYYSPRKSDDTPAIPWQLDATTTGLDWDAPTLEQHGRTILDLLNALMDRRRGLSWRLVVTDTETVRVTPFTWTVSEVTLPSGATLPANPRCVTLDFDEAVNVERSVVRSNAVNRYDRVIAQGNRRGSLITLAFDDSTLQADWTAAQETTYQNAAKDETGYGSLDIEEQRVRNAAYRASDVLDRVYSWFIVVDAWNGQVGDGEGGTKYKAFPVIDQNGNVTTESMKFWLPGLRCETYTPMQSSIDYSGSNIADGLTDQSPSGSANELRPPFVIIKANPKFQVFRIFVEEIGVGREPDWSCSCRVRDDAIGFILDVQGGKQHFLDVDNFTGTDADEDGPGVFLDYKDLIATLYVQHDAFAEAVWPATVPDTDVTRELLIQVPDAYLDWVPVGTVVDLENGDMKKVTTGAFIRDDRDRLKDVARSAYEWYGTDRRALELTYRGIFATFELGHLITQIGSAATQESINTVVTYVHFDFVNGTTSIATQFADLDVVSL